MSGLNLGLKYQLHECRMTKAGLGSGTCRKAMGLLGYGVTQQD
jgi:hypothetical protein